MKKKLRSKSGLTLVEMLAAVAVLSLMSVMIHTGLQLVINNYHTMIGKSETQLLLSTVTDTLADELRYARDIDAGEDGLLKTFTSVSYGRRTEILIGNKGQLLANGKRLIASGAYGNGRYTVTELVITYDNPVFSVHVKVSGTGDIAAETDFDVTCLNSAPEKTTE